MSLSITALNEKLNMTKDSKTFITWSQVRLGLILMVLSSVSLTMQFGLGIVFMIPMIALVTTYKKQWGYVLSLFIGLGTLVIDIRGSLSIILGILLLLIFTSDQRQKIISHYILSFISLVSYFVNVFLELSTFNPFALLFIGLYSFVFYTIYNKAIEIKLFNTTKERHLFPEEIIAILALTINILLGLYWLELSLINIGYIATLVVIMALGVLSSPIYVIGYTLIVYLLLQYTNLTYEGIHIIPFIGFISALIPKKYINSKALLFYILSPVLFYLGMVQGNILYILINLSLATKVYFFMGDYLYKNHASLLIYQNSENNLYNIYMENFKEDISKRLLNFAEIFETFANKSTESNNDLQKIDDSINEIVEKHCKNCLKKELCLNTNYIKTYNYFTQILKEGNQIMHESKRRFVELFNMYCLNSYDVINTSIYLNEEYLLNNTKTESLVYQSQLYGLSRIIQGYAMELNSNYENNNERILRFKEALNKLGIMVSYFKVNNIAKYNINVDLGVTTRDEINQVMIQSLFEDVFKEEVTLCELKSQRENKRFRIESKKEFNLDFGTSYIGKDGKRISGDNFIKCTNHQGNTIVALCDGMGTGYSAHIESKTTLELLNKMLDTGADDEMTVSVINTLVSLKEYKERFSTLDYLVINQSSKTVDFYKIGSAPSFIIRGNRVIRIDNDNLPIGFTESIDKISVDLEMDDIIIVVSDGIVERLNNMAKFESILTKMAKTAPIQMAHDIIQVVIKENNGKILDDMTAIVLKVTKDKVA
jgi:stage II sporulation protein E